ncbi:LEAFY [Rhynchospora pubera]|uniref:Floricaula/leafy-like transcription factor n=1 Tax=Rhynchospora pubera TaxID=906938 RepID=A0AAV8FVQ8_9POAL|nr:LEAFY [Rhynchospora pubera]
MDPAGDAFKWDQRTSVSGAATSAPPPPIVTLSPPPLMLYDRPRDLDELVDGFGVRYATMARIGELGFTSSTLIGMTDGELDEMMATLAHVFRWDLMLGERYGLKAAIRAERGRLEGLRIMHLHQRHQLLGAEQLQQLGYIQHHGSVNADALSQEVLSEEPVQEAAGSGGETRSRTGWLCPRSNSKSNIKKRTDSRNKKHKGRLEEVDQQDEGEADDRGRGWESASSETERDGGSERQREHPFIVTEPGEVARAKKNGLDYLFHLYEQCRLFLVQVQALARQHGHKCPTKVTNQVFRYAKKAGASHINKPKMRHYVHCYALHCLDEEASNALRKAFKERRQNVGAWRQACYEPLVNISARHNWDIDVVFNSHPRLSIWYVPTKLRQLCHIASSNAGTNAATAGTGTVGPILGSGSGDLLQQPSSIF